MTLAALRAAVLALAATLSTGALGGVAAFAPALASAAPALTAAPAAGPDEAGHPIVVDVVIQGADPAPLLPLIPVQRGQRLDVRSVRQAIRALHATARFSRVQAFTEPAAGGVRLVFSLEPVRRLVSIAFQQNRALGESALVQAANLQVNAEFQRDQVDRAVEAMRAVYFRAGYRDARIGVQTQVVEGGVALTLLFDEGPPTRIASLEFRGDPGLANAALSTAFAIGPGDVLDLGALDEGTRVLRERYRSLGRLRAQVGAPLLEDAGPQRKRVVIPVQASRPVRFLLRGNRTFRTTDLLQQMAAAGADEEILDAQALEDRAGRLRRFYVEAGFLSARVQTREVTGRDGADVLVFSIDEGAPVRVEAIRFPGATLFTEAALRERVLLLLRDTLSTDPAHGTDPGLIDRVGLAGHVRGAPAPRYHLDPETVYEPALYARALQQIEDLYKSQGYLAVRAGPPRVEPLGKDAGRVAVVVPIVEGERTRVRRVDVEGAGAAVPAAELASDLVLRSGAPFSYLAAEEGRVALTQSFTRRGHLYARVDDDEEFDEPADPPRPEREVRVRYRVEPGPVVRVGLIEVVGSRRTDEGLIRELIALRAGDLVTPEALDRGEQALLRTGLFFSATLTPRNGEVAEARKTIQVQLRERPTRDFQLGLGFSLADGPRASAQFTQGNVFGRNLTLAVVGRANFPFLRYTRTEGTCTTITQVDTGANSGCSRVFDPPQDPLERIVDIGLSAPRLYPLTNLIRGGVDLIHQRAVRSSYQLTKVSGQANLELVQRRPFSAGVTYEVGYQALAAGADRTIDDFLAGIDKDVLRLPIGRMLFGSLRPTLTVDLRDDPIRPRAGVFGQLSGDYLTSLNRRSIPVNLFKVQATLAGYIPLPRLASIVVSGRAGRIYQLDDRSLTPGDRRFYLGGATTLRGFHEDALQPQDLIESLRAKVDACNTLLSNIACTTETALLRAGIASSGGEQFLTFSGELRAPVSSSFELGLFYDAGNLWSKPRSFTAKLSLRDAVGVGLRWLSPIGRMAIDLGMNLSPNDALGEPRFGPYFSLEAL